MRVRESRDIGYAAEFCKGTVSEIYERFANYCVDLENCRFTTEYVQDSDSRVILHWDRPETDKERAKRLKRSKTAKIAKKQKANNKRAQELQTLETPMSHECPMCGQWVNTESVLTPEEEEGIKQFVDHLVEKKKSKADRRPSDKLVEELRALDASA